MKIDNYKAALKEYLAERNRQDFKYGVLDCVRFAADWGSLATGIDYIEPYREAYTNKAEAKKLLKEKTLLKRTTEQMGKPLEAVAFAQVGDIVLWGSRVRGQTLGICIGQKSAFMGLRGLKYRDTGDCTHAWRL